MDIKAAKILCERLLFADTRSHVRGAGVPSMVGVGTCGVSVNATTAAVAARAVAVAGAGVGGT